MSSVSVRFNSFLSLFDFQWTLVNLFWLTWSVWMDSNHRPHAYQACALTTWATDRFFWWFPCSFPSGIPFRRFGGDDGVRTHDPLLAGQVLSQLSYTPIPMGLSFSKIFLISENWTTKASILRATDLVIPTPTDSWKSIMVSIERRWSSRTFRYGYLVTT